MGLGLAFLAFFVINVNTFITIRIPSLWPISSWETARSGQLDFRGMQLMGILSGALFGFLVGRLKDWLCLWPMWSLAWPSCLPSPLIYWSWLWGHGIGLLYSVVLNIVFSRTTENTARPVDPGRDLVLMGCNWRSDGSILPTFLETLNPTPTGAFWHLCSVVPWSVWPWLSNKLPEKSNCSVFCKNQLQFIKL